MAEAMGPNKLKPYQKDAVARLLVLMNSSLRSAILAHDMGLRKTVITIAFREMSRCKGPEVIVCSKYVTDVWLAELRRWLPKNVKVFVSTELRIKVRFQSPT